MGITVDILSDDLDSLIEMLNWAKRNCPGYITVTGNANGEVWYRFYFDNAKDANWFMLRWT